MDKGTVKQLIAPSLIYGIAWKLAIFHVIAGFVFLIVAGFIYGLGLLFRDHMMKTIVGVLVTIALGFISTIPVIGPLIAALITLYLAWKQLSYILENLLLIFAGFGMFFLLFQTPHYFHTLYMTKLGLSSNGFVDFLIGFSLYAIVVMLLAKLGYAIKNIFVFTIGLPGFIFLFYISRKNSPFN